jgi:hypothetical protein
MRGVGKRLYRGGRGGAARNDDAPDAAFRKPLHILLQGMGIEPVEIIRFGIAEYLYPVRMDEIEMANHPLRRLGDGIIVELILAALPAALPDQIQLLVLVVK